MKWLSKAANQPHDITFAWSSRIWIPGRPNLEYYLSYRNVEYVVRPNISGYYVYAYIGHGVTHFCNFHFGQSFASLQFAQNAIEAYIKKEFINGIR